MSDSDGIKNNNEEVLMASSSSPSSSCPNEQYFICSKCRSYLKVSSASSQQQQRLTSSCCVICRGLWQEDDDHVCKLQLALGNSCQPYGGIANNSFCELNKPTISISGDLFFRYMLWYRNNNKSEAAPFSVYLHDLKQHLNRNIKDVIVKDSAKQQQKQQNDNNKDYMHDSKAIQSEEQGCLSIHVLCVPSKDNLSTLDGLLELCAGTKSSNKKRKRHNSKRRQPFHNSVATQGGDPRTNLETRLKSQGYHWMTQSMVEESGMSVITMISNDTFHPSSSSSFMYLQNYLSEESNRMEYHVAVHRRPIFLYGYYTKSRRDVSQTPFVVMRDVTVNHNDTDNDKKQPKKKHAEILGVTSVEEQICNPIRNLLGISTCNNNSINTSCNDDGSGGGGVLYGMVKMHSSGREDMDVRMLVRTNSSNCRGRPFCVQIIDALRPISSNQQLQDLANTINHTNSNDDDEKTTTATTNNVISYGNNPLGVGISADYFKQVPSKFFSGLQADTESKVKHYGCYCWSKKELPICDDLTSIIFSNFTFPLTIQQKTPIRVLHRRANAIRQRQILRAKSIRIDNHHFRLELSTQAGTYVKEFVYGDLGRTQPSVSSLLGTKTCLLELDCEGIEIS